MRISPVFRHLSKSLHSRPHSRSRLCVVRSVLAESETKVEWSIESHDCWCASLHRRHASSKYGTASVVDLLFFFSVFLRPGWMASGWVEGRCGQGACFWFFLFFVSRSWEARPNRSLGSDVPCFWFFSCFLLLFFVR